MVKYIANKIKPKKGFAHIAHLFFVALVPPVILLFVRLDLVIVAVAVLLLSKWRMFAVRPRHWLTHFRANAVDLIVGLSVVALMANTTAFAWQLFMLAAYELWLLVVKPRSSAWAVTAQALTAQVLGLVAIFLGFRGASLSLYIVGFWLVSYFSARHFLSGFDEKHNNLIASVWAFFAASFMWILGHWLVFIGPIAQPALLLSVFAFSLSGLYYLDRHHRLTKTIKQQILLTMFAVIFVMIIFSDWGDKAL